MSTSHRADSTDAARLSMALLYKQLMKATPRSRGFKIVYTPDHKDERWPTALFYRFRIVSRRPLVLITDPKP